MYKPPHGWSQRLPRLNAVLLALVGATIFILPLFPKHILTYLYPALFSCIFLVAAFALKEKRKSLMIIAIVLTILLWVGLISRWETMIMSIRCLQIIFFFFMVSGLVRDISNTPQVTKTVIVDAIAGYLLLGFSYALLATLITFVEPDAFYIPNIAATHSADHISEKIYYTFITYTTTGYGDVLPEKPIAKSFAILTGISGQLYIAIIIAMLVGKYSSMKN